MYESFLSQVAKELSLLTRSEVDMNELEYQIADVLEGLAPQMSPRDVTNVRDLLSAGEAGVALEVLCTQLYEFDVPVTLNDLRRIRQLTEVMVLPAHLWRDLDVID